MPVSEKMVREVIEIVSSSVPWFCQIVNMSSRTSANNQKQVHGGKENSTDVEGLLIFAKRREKLIAREDVLEQFRSAKLGWENQSR